MIPHNDIFLSGVLSWRIKAGVSAALLSHPNSRCVFHCYLLHPRSYVSLFNTVNKVSKISFTFGISYLHAEPQLWSNLRHQSSPGCFTSVFVSIKLWKAKYSQMTGSSHHATAVSLQSIAVIAAGLDFFKFTLVKASSWSTGCGRLEQ